MGCVGEKPKTGKAGSSSDVGRSESGKIKEQGNKKFWSCVCRLLIGTLVWPCPVPNHCTVCPVFLLNSLLTLSWVKDCLRGEGVRPSASSCSQTVGWSDHVSMMPATGTCGGLDASSWAWAWAGGLGAGNWGHFME